MSRTWLVVVKVLAALTIVGLVVGLLVVGGLATYRAGWSQGYRAGQRSAESDEGTIAPEVHPGFGYPGRAFGFVSLLLGVGLFFLLLIAIGKFFRLLAWQKMMAGGPWRMAPHWARHWHAPHGPTPPWCWGWEKPPEEEARTTGGEPDAGTGTVGAEG